MNYGYGWMWGMHWAMWILWILLLVLLVVILVRVLPGRPAGPSNASSPTPLEILDRRYAAGEISTAEYEERKAKLTAK
jgi:putative membrane protein